MYYDFSKQRTLDAIGKIKVFYLEPAKSKFKEFLKEFFPSFTLVAYLLGSFPI